jgi:hypothetical protein
MRYKKYCYFISYNHSCGFGNCEMHRSKRIVSFEDIKDLKRVIEKDFKVNDVIILFFVLLREV